MLIRHCYYALTQQVHTRPLLVFAGNLAGNLIFHAARAHSRQTRLPQKINCEYIACFFVNWKIQNGIELHLFVFHLAFFHFGNLDFLFNLNLPLRSQLLLRHVIVGNRC